MLVVIMACSAGKTSVTGSWTKLDYEPEQFRKIVILGIGHNSENRRIFEDQVETRLAAKGYPVIAALDLLPPNAAIGTITKDIVNEIFKAADVDAVAVTVIAAADDPSR